MITAVLVDDEFNNIENLSNLLHSHCPDVSIIGTATNAESAKAIIEEKKPELVFLDIQMPDKSGFDLLQSLDGHNFEVIFVTAHDRYGIQAIKFSAVDYLLKPVDIGELKSAVQKAVSRKSQQSQNKQVQNLLQLLNHQNFREEHRIALPTAKETRFVETQKIVRCESSNNYTAFFFQSGEKLVVSKPIYEFEELLKDYGFLRCHQSHLVNKKYIKSWVKEDGGYLVLEDGTEIPISRQKKEMLRAVLV